MGRDAKHTRGFDISDLPDEQSIKDYIDKQQDTLIAVSKPRALYLVLTIALFVIAISVIVLGTALIANGYVHPLRFGNFVIMSLMFVFIALVCVFRGLRPMNRKYKRAQHAIRVLQDALDEGLYAGKFEVSESAETAGVADGETDTKLTISNEGEKESQSGVADVLTKNSSNDAMNEFFKIFERGIRNPLVPEVPEYKILRKKWRMAVGAGFALMALSLVLMYLIPSLMVGSSLLLALSYIVLIGSLIYDQKRLKPMRSAWARKVRMTEFEMRYDMKAVSQNNKYHKKKGEN